MQQYVIKRVALFFPTLILATMLIFALFFKFLGWLSSLTETS
mgnify:CR=1 FL=1